LPRNWETPLLRLRLLLDCHWVNVCGNTVADVVVAAAVAAAAVASARLRRSQTLEIPRN